MEDADTASISSELMEPANEPSPENDTLPSSAEINQANTPLHLINCLLDSIAATPQAYQIFRIKFDGHESHSNTEFWFNDSLELIFYSESWVAETYLGETRALLEAGKPIALMAMEGDVSDHETQDLYLDELAPECGRSWPGMELDKARFAVQDSHVGERQTKEILQELIENKQKVIDAIANFDPEDWESELQITLLDTLDFGGSWDAYKPITHTYYEFTEAMIPWFKQDHSPDTTSNRRNR